MLRFLLTFVALLSCSTWALDLAELQNQRALERQILASSAADFEGGHEAWKAAVAQIEDRPVDARESFLNLIDNVDDIDVGSKSIDIGSHYDSDDEIRDGKVIVRPQIRFRRVARRVGRVARRVGRAVGRGVGRAVRSVGRGIRRVVGHVKKVVKKAKKVVKVIAPIIKQIAINYLVSAVPVAGQIYAAYQVYKAIQDPKSALLNIAKQYVAGFIPPEVTDVINKAQAYKKEFEKYKQILKNPKTALKQFGKELVGNVLAQYDLTEVENAINRYKEIEKKVKDVREIIKNPKEALRKYGRPFVEQYLEEHASDEIKKVQEIVQQFKDTKKQFKDIVASKRRDLESLLEGITAKIEDRRDYIEQYVTANLEPVHRAMEHVKNKFNTNLDRFNEEVVREVLGVATIEIAEQVAKFDAELSTKLEVLSAALTQNTVIKTVGNRWNSIKMNGREVANQVKDLVNFLKSNRWDRAGSKLAELADIALATQPGL